MAQQLLNRAQVGAPLQEVRREGVTQRVRADAHARTAGGDIAPDQSIDASDRQPRSAVVDKQRILQAVASGLSRTSADEPPPVAPIRAGRLPRPGVDRAHALL